MSTWTQITSFNVIIDFEAVHPKTKNPYRNYELGND